MKKVPVIDYSSGERVVIGEAYVDIGEDYVDVTATIKSEFMPERLKKEMFEHLSIGPQPSISMRQRVPISRVACGRRDVNVCVAENCYEKTCPSGKSDANGLQ